MSFSTHIEVVQPNDVMFYISYWYVEERGIIFYIIMRNLQDLLSF